MSKITIKTWGATIVMGCLFHTGLWAQQSLTLPQAIKEARQHTSLAQLEGIIKQENENGLSVINKKWLPQVQLQAQASYQSETTGLDLSFPGINIPRLSNDQYKVQADLSQMVYDGGTTSALRHLQRQKSALEYNGVSNEMDAIAETTTQVFFSVAEAEQRLQQIDISIQDLDAGIQRANVAIEAGIMLASEGDHLRAERLKLSALKEEIEAMVQSGYDALTLLTGKQVEGLNAVTQLLPDTSFNANAAFLMQFDLQKSMAMANGDLESTAILPKLALFAQTGYGKPGLNFLKNEFEPYYIVGLRLTWQLSAFYTHQTQQQLTQLALSKAEAKKGEITNRKLIKTKQLYHEWRRLSNAFERDEEMVTLRKKILSIAEVQLSNGQITASEYLVKLNDVSEARINLELNAIKKNKAAWLMQLNMGWL